MTLTEDNGDDNQDNPEIQHAIALLESFVTDIDCLPRVDESSFDAVRLLHPAAEGIRGEYPMDVSSLPNPCVLLYCYFTHIHEPCFRKAPDIGQS